MSHQCGCINACNCTIDEDGYYANRPTDGRRNTIVSGKGTPNDPITFQFVQSKFYQPLAGEIQYVDILTVNNTERDINEKQGDPTITVYQTPTVVFAYLPASSTGIAIMEGHYHIAGASAHFTSNATGNRYLAVFGVMENTDLGSDVLLIGGQSSIGNSTRDSVLTCSGMSSGLIEQPVSPIPGISNARFDYWVVGVKQTSGGDLNLERLKFWVVTL